MKHIALFALIIFSYLMAYSDGSKIKVIKYVQFGQVQWDFCDHVGIENGIPFYVKYDIGQPITNYLKNDFKVLTLADYDRERKK